MSKLWNLGGQNQRKKEPWAIHTQELILKHRRVKTSHPRKKWNWKGVSQIHYQAFILKSHSRLIKVLILNNHQGKSTWWDWIDMFLKRPLMPLSSLVSTCKHARRDVTSTTTWRTLIARHSLVCTWHALIARHSLVRTDCAFIARQPLARHCTH